MSIDFNLSKEIMEELTGSKYPTIFEFEREGQEKIKVVRYEDYEKLENIIKEVRDILRKHICNPSGLKNGWHIDCWNNEDISKLNEDLGILDRK